MWWLPGLLHLKYLRLLHLLCLLRQLRLKWKRPLVWRPRLGGHAARELLGLERRLGLGLPHGRMRLLLLGVARRAWRHVGLPLGRNEGHSRRRHVGLPRAHSLREPCHHHLLRKTTATAHGNPKTGNWVHATSSTAHGGCHPVQGRGQRGQLARSRRPRPQLLATSPTPASTGAPSHLRDELRPRILEPLWRVERGLGLLLSVYVMSAPLHVISHGRRLAPPSTYTVTVASAAVFVHALEMALVLSELGLSGLEFVVCEISARVPSVARSLLRHCSRT